MGPRGPADRATARGGSPSSKNAGATRPVRPKPPCMTDDYGPTLSSLRLTNEDLRRFLDAWTERRYGIEDHDPGLRRLLAQSADLRSASHDPDKLTSTSFLYVREVGQIVWRSRATTTLAASCTLRAQSHPRLRRRGRRRECHALIRARVLPSLHQISGGKPRRTRVRWLQVETRCPLIRYAFEPDATVAPALRDRGVGPRLPAFARSNTASRTCRDGASKASRNAIRTKPSCWAVQLRSVELGPSRVARRDHIAARRRRVSCPPVSGRR